MKVRRRHLGSVVAAVLVVPAWAMSSSNGLPTAIGKGEGKLTMITWQGYAQDEWVKPFEKQTGCRVSRRYAESSDEMVALMRGGGWRPVRSRLRVRRCEPHADLQPRCGRGQRQADP
jgi:spermidine/putrescine-binding protein